MLIQLGYALARNRREQRLVNLLTLLFGFSGRINRAQYWLGGLCAGVGTLIVIAVLMAIGGPVDPAVSEQERAAHFFRVFAMALIPALLAGSWIGYALAWKRFHDRGKSGVWVFLPVLPSFMMVSSIFSALASGANPLALGGAAQPWATMLWVIQLWFLVELGFLPGKEGPNKYGPAPGGGSPLTTPGAPVAPGKSVEPIPGMQSALGGAESAMERAIAARARAEAATATAAASASAPVDSSARGLRSPSGSFGRKSAH